MFGNGEVVGMLDDQSMNLLARSLVDLERCAGQLDELVVPRTPSCGENAGKPPSRRGSKPPVVVGMLDLKLRVEATLHYWCGWLLRDGVCIDPTVGDDPPGGGIVAMAVWLRQHVLVLGQMQWGQLAADEICGNARLVVDVIDPPMGSTDPRPLEVGTSREIASWCRHLGADVSRARIQRWIAEGQLTAEVVPDGRVLVRLDDVLALDRARGGALAAVFGM